MYYEDSNYGDPLPIAIRSRIKGCHVFCCDLTGHSPNVFYELGFAHALKKKLVVVMEDKKGSKIPSDVVDLTVALYSDRASLEQRLQKRITELVKEFVDLDQVSLIEPFDRCMWFGERPSDISIICSPEPEKSRFADPSSNAFIFVDNLEDRDALLEVSMYLSRAFPRAGIQRHDADGLAHDFLASNLVLLGGQKNNSVTRDFLTLLSVDLTYDYEGMTLTLPSGDPIHVAVERNSAGYIVRDAGYFGLFPNPFRIGRRVAICIGSHTFGTHGAAKVMDDSFQGIKNSETVRALAAARGASSSDSVQLLFSVAIMLNRKVPTPHVDPDKIWIAM
ncbi:MAG: hypothetical protein ABTR92_12610 [Candidatus Accumulibacter phosphatis]